MILKYEENMGIIELFVIYMLDSAIEVMVLSVFFILPMKDVIYQNLFDYFGLGDKMMFVVVTSLVHSLSYFFSFAFYQMCEQFNLLEKYKIKKTEKMKGPSQELILKTLKDALIGQFIFQPILLYIIYDYATEYGMIMNGPLPSFFEAFQTLFWYYHFLEICFYFSHRLLHHPLLYKRFHKQHHEYKDTISISAEHSSFVESLISAQIPSLVILLSGCHYSLFLSILILRLYTTYEVHSGYSFPWSLGYRSEYHYFHHSANIGNYSASVFLDSLFGTNDAWNEHYRILNSKKLQERESIGDSKNILSEKDEFEEKYTNEMKDNDNNIED
eukprot:TRINITY_DN6566_c0_g2_i1.p1 TRINITY_DN6566_c0_g2~~TRINITY_DN6566_c0_g2_i1.p1  ORF type:complete len:329 (-),score=34.68 TRINITY_DN6566_c0_g2_i1:79-1065(-)